ncbi:MAG: hypothetical protein V1897_05440 [Pseudomonadota bacterium]
MYVLCDTCSVLMLIRIAPDMFIDQKYDCVTVPEVRQEFVQTKKFKTKYPWREKYVAKIRAIPKTQLDNDVFQKAHSTVRTVHDTGLINPRTNKLFDLSRVDKLIISYAVAHNYVLSSVDNDLVDFAEQQFEKSVVRPLGIINDWLGRGLIDWDDSLQSIIDDWTRCGEHRQPIDEIQKFKSLTGYLYVGP